MNGEIRAVMTFLPKMIIQQNSYSTDPRGAPISGVLKYDVHYRESCVEKVVV